MALANRLSFYFCLNNRGVTISEAWRHLLWHVCSARSMVVSFSGLFMEKIKCGPN